MSLQVALVSLALLTFLSQLLPPAVSSTEQSAPGHFLELGPQPSKSASPESPSSHPDVLVRDHVEVGNTSPHVLTKALGPGQAEEEVEGAFQPKPLPGRINSQTCQIQNIFFLF